MDEKFCIYIEILNLNLVYYIDTNIDDSNYTNNVKVKKKSLDKNAIIFDNGILNIIKLR